MTNWTLCKHDNETKPGNILNWQTMAVDEKFVTKQLLSMKEYCSVAYNTVFLLPGARSYEESHHICKVFKSEFYIFKDTLKNTVEKENYDPTARVWSGFKLDIDTNRY